MRHTVGQLVRDAREAMGLTVGAAADRAGIAKAYISMIENHRVAPPSEKVLDAIADALRIDRKTLHAAAQWESAPPLVRQTAERAEQARELVRWLHDSTSRKAGGGRNLDRLFRSGELRRRVAATLGEDTEAEAGVVARVEPDHVDRAGGAALIPLINKVAAGYPTEFTDLGYPARVGDETIVCPDVGDPDAFAARVVGASMMPDYREGDIVVFSPLADIDSGCDCFVRLEPDHDSTFKRVYFEKGGSVIRLVPLNPRYHPSRHPREHVAGLYRAVWSMRRV